MLALETVQTEGVATKVDLVRVASREVLRSQGVELHVERVAQTDEPGDDQVVVDGDVVGVGLEERRVYCEPVHQVSLELINEVLPLGQDGLELGHFLVSSHSCSHVSKRRRDEDTTSGKEELEVKLLEDAALEEIEVVVRNVERRLANDVVQGLHCPASKTPSAGSTLRAYAPDEAA